MTIIVPLIALFLALLARFVFRAHEPSSPKIAFDRIVSVALVLALGAGLASRFGPPGDQLGLDVGLAVGAAAALLGELLGGWIAPMAIGVAAASALHALPASSLAPAQLALLVGGGLGVLALGRDGALTATLMATVVAAADALGGKHSDAASAGMVGSLMGVAAIVAAFLSWAPKNMAAWLRPLATAVLVGVGAFLATRNLNEPYLLFAAGFGAAAGLVLHFLLSAEGGDGVRIGLAAVIAIGVATVAFGLAKGYGMSLALVAAVGVLAAMNNRRALLAIGPLVGLVLYRVFRETHPDASRALDIGQHYALLGLALGIVVPLLPAASPRVDKWRGAAASVLWGVLALALPALIVLMLGAKGAIGFVAGLGFSGFCEALRGRRDLLPLSLAGGLAATTILLIGWFAEAEEMTRDQKVRTFAIAAAAIVVVAGLLALVTRPQKEEAKA